MRALQLHICGFNITCKKNKSIREIKFCIFLRLHSIFLRLQQLFVIGLTLHQQRCILFCLCETEKQPKRYVSEKY